MAKESTLTLTLKVDDQGTVVLDKFTKNIAKAGQDVSKITKAMEVVTVAAFINIGKEAIRTASWIFNFGRSIASAGNDIQRMSRVFNMSTEDFQKWSYVAKMADVDIEGFGQGMKFLTRSMSEALQGSGDAAKAFQLLGINLRDTTGRTKDQQTVMLEIIDTFGKFEDGVNRDALMLAVFGRGWMSFKPMVDQGTDAIKENMKIAEKFNLILGKNTIEALSQAEDAFKRFSFTWQVFKMQFLEPAVSLFGTMLERLILLKKAWTEGGVSGVYKEIMAGQEKERIRQLSWEDWVTVEPYKSKSKKKQAPTIPGKPESDIVKEVQSAIEGMIATEERYAEVYMLRRSLVEEGWEKTKDIVDEVKEELSKLERTTNEWGEITVARQELVEAGWEAADRRLKESRAAWESFGETIATNFNTLFVDVLGNGIKNFGDAFKKFLQSMVNSFISAIGKMIMEWLFFEKVTSAAGTTSKSFLGGGSGIMQLIKSIGTIFLQHGGVFDKPTPAIIGEAGPEAVIPLKGGKIPVEGGQGGMVIINNVYATDVKSFEDQVNRNPGCIINVLMKSVRTSGAMREIIRGA